MRNLDLWFNKSYPRLRRGDRPGRPQAVEDDRPYKDEGCDAQIDGILIAMQKLIDKLVLFGLCLLVLSLTEIQWISIVTALGAVAVSSLCGYFENRLTALFCVGYVVMCLFIHPCVIFLPLIVYDCAESDKWPLRFCWVAALPAGFLLDIPQVPVSAILSSGAAFLLQHRTASEIKARENYYELMDNTNERAELLERMNRDLMEKQDYEVRLATLAERNRIAREIHDNVGHLLTRSLLQVGAMRVTHDYGDELDSDLDLVKGTLSDAMDSIRSSVHDLHDESLDIKGQLLAMADGFKFCPVRLRYDAEKLPPELKYCFIAIVREALSNIARHSNATEATVTVVEHPAFFQLLISDNGAKKPGGTGNGIGLQNMVDRVSALGGVFRAEYNKGFRIFISVPKREIGGQ